MGFINYGLYREDLSILAELTISQGNPVNTSGLLNQGHFCVSHVPPKLFQGMPSEGIKLELK